MNKKGNYKINFIYISSITLAKIVKLNTPKTHPSTNQPENSFLPNKDEHEERQDDQGIEPGGGLSGRNTE